MFRGDDGNDLVTATGGFNFTVTGRGNSVINGSGALGVVTVTGDGNNKIYAGAQTDLATALAQAKAAKASGQRGDFFAVANGNNTIVGGTGNDEIDMGTGNNLVVAGPGKVTVEGGVAVYRAGTRARDAS